MHLVAGVIVGAVVLIMSATGVVLAYERQMLDWVARRHDVAAPASAARLPLDSVLAKVQAQITDRQIVSIGVRSDPSAPLSAGLENRQNLFVDPYTATVLGTDSVPRAFFGSMLRLHRWLVVSGTERSPVGKSITGASNLAFLFLIISGAYLWWPRQLSARAFRAIMVFTRGTRGKARDWNWHHVLGFWSAPALVLIVASAAYMSYAWPGELTQRLMGIESSGPGGREGGEGRPRGEGRGQGEGRAGAREGARAGGREGRAGREGGQGQGRREEAGPVRPIVIQASLDSIWAVAAREAPGWQTIQVRLPREADRPVTLTVATGTGARPDQRSQATFDATTGAKVEWTTYAQGDAFRRFRSWIRPVHTGEAAGLIGQTIAMLVSAAAVVLVWTGIALSLRRLRASLNRRAKKAPELQRAA